MMALLFGDRTHAVYEVQGRPEIGEQVSLRQMGHPPPASRPTAPSFPALFAFERWDATAARHAMLFSQTHDSPSRRSEPARPAVRIGQIALLPLYRFVARPQSGNAAAGASSVPLAPTCTSAVGRSVSGRELLAQFAVN